MAKIQVLSTTDFLALGLGVVLSLPITVCQNLPICNSWELITNRETYRYRYRLVIFSNDLGKSLRTGVSWLKLAAVGQNRRFSLRMYA